MVLVAELSNCGHTLEPDHPDLPRRQSQSRVIPLFGHELSVISGAPHHLSALALLELNVVDQGPEGDVAEFHG